MKLLAIIALLLLSGCANTAWKAGLGMHSNGMDAPEYCADNPVGLVRADTPFNTYLSGFFEHESQIFRREEGFGYNKVGVMINVNETFNWLVK